MSRPTAPYQGGHPLSSGKLKLGWIASYPKSCLYTHSRTPEGKRTPEAPPLPVRAPERCPCNPLPQRQKGEGAERRGLRAGGGPGVALGSRTGVCFLCYVLTTYCFSFRETEQFFPKNAALGGYPVLDPQPVHLAAQFWAHLLQQRQQPLPDVLGASGRVHLERICW